MLSFVVLVVFILMNYELIFESVRPSVLPRLCSLLNYLCGIASELLMYASMAGYAQSLEPLESAVECQPSHLVLSPCRLDRHDMVHAPRRGVDLLLQAFLTQSASATELRSAQLLPLPAVVYLRLVLGLLTRPTSPRQFSFHSA